MQKAATIHKSPEMSAFSHDGSRFAFATGDSVETGLRQMLVYEPSSGKLLLNSKLEQLPKALGVSSTLIPFWPGTDFDTVLQLTYTGTTFASFNVLSEDFDPAASLLLR